MPFRITFLSATKIEITAENMINSLIVYPNPFSQKSPQNEWATRGNIIKLTFWLEKLFDFWQRWIILQLLIVGANEESYILHGSDGNEPCEYPIGIGYV